MLRLGILTLLSKTHGLALPIMELSQALQGRGVIREQKEAGGGIFGEVTLAIMNTVIEPMNREPAALGQVGHGK